MDYNGHGCRKHYNRAIRSTRHINENDLPTTKAHLQE